jgi:hypothetical protein
MSRAGTGNAQPCAFGVTRRTLREANDAAAASLIPDCVGRINFDDELVRPSGRENPQPNDHRVRCCPAGSRGDGRRAGADVDVVADGERLIRQVKHDAERVVL